MQEFRVLLSGHYFEIKRLKSLSYKVCCSTKVPTVFQAGDTLL
jgi:hypothetical protein